MALVTINGDFNNIDTSLTNNGQMLINGNFINDGLVQGNGVYEVMGNWINNSSFLCGISSVILKGGPQLITGTQQTTFYNLSTTGIGVKTMTLNSTVTNNLNLTDRELATDINTIFITNTYPLAVTNSTGFVSSLGNGSLSRNTASSNEYLFPVGSSLGTLRYRPVSLFPTASNNNTFSVSLVNHNATLDGYDISLKDSTICTMDSLYYHRINRTTGVDSANITMYYDPLTDGNWNGMANWKPIPLSQWISMGVGTHQTTPLVGVTEYNWGDFSSDPYALATVSPSAGIIYGDTLVCNNAAPSFYAVWTDTTSTYVWNVINGTIVGDSTSNVVYIDWDSAGVGILSVQQIPLFGACISQPSFLLVNIIPSPIANFTFSPDTNLFTYDLIGFTNTSTGAITYQWNFNDGLVVAQQDPFHVFENVGNYSVSLIATNSFGCTDTSVQKINIVEGIISPNVFTPNDDGFNDYFHIKGSGMEVYNLKIYDRWGQLMFESNSPSAKWDGKTLAGVEASDGTYFYTLISKSGTKDYNRTGTVTLIR